MRIFFLLINVINWRRFLNCFIDLICFVCFFYLFELSRYVDFGGILIGDFVISFFKRCVVLIVLSLEKVNR